MIKYDSQQQEQQQEPQQEPQEDDRAHSYSTEESEPDTDDEAEQAVDAYKRSLLQDRPALFRGVAWFDCE